jgi:hypothetical protein
VLESDLPGQPDLSAMRKLPVGDLSSRRAESPVTAEVAGAACGKNLVEKGDF